MDNEIQKLNKQVTELQTELRTLKEIFYKNRFSGIQIETKDFSHKGGKLGFYSLTPIAQPSSTGETTGASDVTLNNATTFTGNNGATAYTVLDVVKHLKNLGILKK